MSQPRISKIKMNVNYSTREISQQLTTLPQCDNSFHTSAPVTQQEDISRNNNFK